MNITIVGGGKVGETLCQDLAAAKHDVTLIDTDADLISKLINSFDITGFVGNGALYDVQKESNVAEADIFIAVSPQDETNLIAALTAKYLGAKKTIARVRNPNYTKQANFLRNKLGIDMIINPELQAARDIAGNLQFPQASNVEQFAHDRGYLLNLKLPFQSPIIGLNMAAVRNRFNSVIILAIERKDSSVLIPFGLTEICEGDRIFVTGDIKELNLFYAYLGYSQTKIKNALIVGAGKITNHLIPRLLRGGIEPKVIEVNRTAAENLSMTYPDITVINEDGTNQQILDAEHLADYDVSIALTGIDEENLLISLYAEKLNVTKVISKVNRTNLLCLLYREDHNHIDSHSIITPRLLVADQIVRFVRAYGNASGSNVDALYRLCGDKVEVLQFNVKAHAACCNIPLANLATKKNILIAYIIRDNKLIFPGGSDIIQTGDKVLIVTTHKNFDDIDDILVGGTV